MDEYVEQDDNEELVSEEGDVENTSEVDDISDKPDNYELNENASDAAAKKDDVDADADVDDASDTSALPDEAENVIHEESEEEQEFEEKIPRTENTLHKEVIIVDPEKRQTSNVLTEFELTEAIAIRATQIEERNMSTTNVDGLDSAQKMAEKEIKDGRCPLVLRRKVGEKVVKDGDRAKLTEYIEFWDINTMTLPIQHGI
jgi:hypothetical protein